MKKILIIVVLTIIIILGFNSLNRGIDTGETAHDFSLQDYKGNTITLSDYRGDKGVFVNFWASWCPFCVEELPLMATVQEEFGDQYVTIAINRAESLKIAKEFSDQLDVTDEMIFVLDPDDKVYGQYGGFAMPYSIFIDKNGVIIDTKFGPLTEQELREKINKIIN